MDKNDGYTQVPNDLLEAVYTYGFTIRQLRIVLYIIRKTYGYHLQERDISISRMAVEMGVDRAHASRTVSDLEKLNVLSVEKNGAWKASTMYVKNPDEWDRPITEKVRSTVAKSATAKRAQCAKTATVPKQPQCTVAKTAQGGVPKQPQCTVAKTATQVKKEINGSERKGKKGPSGPIFSQTDEGDEDDGGMDPDELSKQWKEEKVKNGHL